MVAGAIEEIGLQVIKRYFGFFTIGVIILIAVFILVKRTLKRRLDNLGEEGPFHD